MKKNRFLFLLNLIILAMLGSFLSPLNADEEKSENIPPLNSIEWQKVNLQQKIVQKVERAVGNFVKATEFVVDVEIELAAWKAPVFAPPADPQDEEDKKKQEEEEKKKKAEEEAQKQKKEDAKKGVKFDDYKLEPVPKDYLIFQKLGLEVPLIDTFKDEVKVEEKTPINFPEIKIPPPNKPSDIERERYNALIKYNESFDLFKNLQAITINVWLNKNVEANIKSTVEKVVRGLALTYGEISADVKVSYLEYAVPEVVIEEKPLEW